MKFWRCCARPDPVIDNGGRSDPWRCSARSRVRGEDSRASDVDILVEFERPIGLSAFLALEASLAGWVGRPVDLVSRGALKPHISRRILAEALPL